MFGCHDGLSCFYAPEVSHKRGMAVIANFTAGKVIGKPLTKERGIARAHLFGLLP